MEVTKRRVVRFGDATIEYEVRRSRRRKKTVHMSVDRHGVRVAAPWNTPSSELEAFVLKRATWILGHLRDAESAEATHTSLAAAEALPYLGRPVPMTVETAEVGSPEVGFDDQRFRVVVQPHLTGDDLDESIRGVMAGWYKAQAAQRLAAEVCRWWPRLGVIKESRVIIGNQRRRWGSCAADGTLRFSWRVMLLEPSLIEYIVVHEMAHLTHLDHSAAFWGLVAQVLPDVPDRRRRLRETERGLPI